MKWFIVFLLLFVVFFALCLPLLTQVAGTIQQSKATAIVAACFLASCISIGLTTQALRALNPRSRRRR